MIKEVKKHITVLNSHSRGVQIEITTTFNTADEILNQPSIISRLLSRYSVAIIDFLPKLPSKPSMSTLTKICPQWVKFLLLLFVVCLDFEVVFLYHSSCLQVMNNIQIGQNGFIHILMTNCFFD
jgi:hypothetical protein